MFVVQGPVTSLASSNVPRGQVTCTFAPIFWMLMSGPSVMLWATSAADKMRL